jgi:putative transposase
MSGPAPAPITVTDRQRAALAQLVRRATSPQRLVRRARIILAAAEGANNQQIAAALGVDRETARLWRETWRGAADWLAALEADPEAADRDLGARIARVLADHPRSGAPVTFAPEQVCQILALACEPPAACDRPVPHWTPRELADEAVARGIAPAISPRTVGRFLRGGRDQAPPRA